MRPLRFGVAAAIVFLPGRAFHLAADDTFVPGFWLTSAYASPVFQGTTFSFAGGSKPTVILQKTTYQLALYSTGT